MDTCIKGLMKEYNNLPMSPVVIDYLVFTNEQTRPQRGTWWHIHANL